MRELVAILGRKIRGIAEDLTDRVSPVLTKTNITVQQFRKSALTVSAAIGHKFKSTTTTVYKKISVSKSTNLEITNGIQDYVDSNYFLQNYLKFFTSSGTISNIISFKTRFKSVFEQQSKTLTVLAKRAKLTLAVIDVETLVTGLVEVSTKKLKYIQRSTKLSATTTLYSSRTLLTVTIAELIKFIKLFISNTNYTDTTSILFDKVPDSDTLTGTDIRTTSINKHILRSSNVQNYVNLSYFSQQYLQDAQADSPDSFELSDSLRRTVSYNRSILDNSLATDIPVFSTIKGISDTSSYSDSLTRTVEYNRSFLSTGNLSEEFLVELLYAFYPPDDTLGYTDTIVRTVNYIRDYVDSTNYLDDYSLHVTKNIVDQSTYTDSTTIKTDYIRQFSDSSASTDITLFTFNKIINNTANYTDNLSTIVAFIREFLDQSNSSDNIESIYTKVLTEQSDYTDLQNLTISKVALGNQNYVDFEYLLDYLEGALDTIAIKDGINRIAVDKGIVEQNSYADTYESIFIKPVTDSAGYTDSTIQTVDKGIAESNNYTDSFDRVISYIRDFTDVNGYTDTYQSTFTKSITDQNSYTDNVNRTVSFIREFTENNSYTDTYQSTFVKSVTDQNSYTDNFNRNVSFIRDFTDVNGYTDTYESEFIKAITDENNYIDLDIFDLYKVVDSGLQNYVEAEYLLDYLNNAEELASVFDNIDRIAVAKSILDIVTATDDIDGEATLEDDQTQIFFKTVTDSGGYSDTIATTVSFIRQFTENNSYTDIYQATIGKSVADQGNYTDSSIYSFVKDVSDQNNYTDNLNAVVSYIRDFTDASGYTDSSLLSFTKSVTDQNSYTDNFDRTVSFVREFTDNSSYTDSYKSDFIKPVTDSAGYTDSTIQTVGKGITESNNYTDNFDTVISYIRDFTDVNGYTDTYQSTFAKSVTDQNSYTDNFNRTISFIRQFTEDNSYTDTYQSTFVKPIADQNSYTDNFDRVISYIRDFTDVNGYTDTYQSTFAKPVIDQNSYTDLDVFDLSKFIDSGLQDYVDTNYLLDYLENTTDGALLGDTISNISVTKSILDIVTATDDIDGETTLEDDQTHTFFKTVTDSGGYSDTLATTVSFIRQFTEDNSYTDIYQASVGKSVVDQGNYIDSNTYSFVKGVSDQNSYTDNLNAVVNYIRNFTDANGYTDTPVLLSSKPVTDQNSYTDNFDRTVSFIRNFTDGNAYTDVLNATVNYIRDFTDANGYTDNSLLSFNKPVTDVNSYTDTISTTVSFVRNFTDSNSYTDVLNATVSYIRDFTDTNSYTDIRQVSFTKSVTDVNSYTDNFDRTVSYTRSFTDTNSYTDINQIAVTKAVSDQSNYTDGIQQSVGKSVVDQNSYTDNLERTVGFIRSFTETNGYTDTYESINSYIRQFIDSANATDDIDGAATTEDNQIATLFKAIQDTNNISDSFIATIIYLLNYNETSNALDIQNLVVQKPLTESTNFVDNLINKVTTKIALEQANLTNPGSLSCHDYVNFTYYSEDYVGVSRIFN